MQGSNDHEGPAARDPYLGLLVSGVFRLEELIGLGKTGRVYRASQIGFARSVAVKVIHRHLMQAPTIRERFHREARLASRLTHPGIVQILASGELASEGDDEIGGEAYLVSEYLLGTSLRQRLREGWPGDVTEALAYMLAVADAVGEAHAQRIIHRDLKPENLMSVAGDHGQLRHVVLDFGLARTLDVQQDPLTHEGAILGSPQYMSPEAARGCPATPRSDVYSLATILYEMLTGHPPFAQGSPMMILLQQAEVEPPPIAASLSIPEPIVDFLCRELAKSPELRSPDATRFAIGLLDAARDAKIPLSRLVMPQLSEAILEQTAEVPS